MNIVTHTYLHLLRCAIYGEACSESSFATWLDAEWYALEQLALRQGTAALVYDVLLQGNTERIPADLLLRMKSLCAGQMMRRPGQVSLLKKTMDALHAGGVHSVLLKGFGLATLYPRPELRSWGDVDIYVGKEQYHEGARLLRDAFPESKHHDEEWEALKHYCLIVQGGVIEMHRVGIKLEHPRDIRIYDPLEEAAMRPSNTEQLYIPETAIRFAVPEGMFNMLYTFMHAWEHFVVEGVGMKQLADVCLLARKEYLRRADNAEEMRTYHDYLMRAVRALRLQQPWQLIGYVCVSCLGLPAEMWQGYWLGAEGSKSQQRWLRTHGDRFVERVMAEGIARETQYEEGEDRYTEREKALRMPIVLRKLKTLRSKTRLANMIAPYSPQYARHVVATACWKGLRRLIHKEETVLY